MHQSSQFKALLKQRYSVRRKPHPERRVNTVFLSNSRDARLSEFAICLQHIQSLQSYLHSFLDRHAPQYNAYCYVTNYQQEKAVIAVTEPAFLIKLRFLAPAILHCFQQDKAFRQLTAVQCRVARYEHLSTPFSTVAPVPRRESKKLSIHATRAIASTAHAITDPILREKWLKLLRHDKKQGE